MSPVFQGPKTAARALMGSARLMYFRGGFQKASFVDAKNSQSISSRRSDFSGCAVGFTANLWACWMQNASAALRFFFSFLLIDGCVEQQRLREKMCVNRERRRLNLMLSG